MPIPPKLPVATVEPVIDNYFGNLITDPYRYMENFGDDGVQQWVKEQADYTDYWLNQIPERDTLFHRMIELEDSVQAQLTNVIRLSNGHIFYLKREADEDVWKLYKRDRLDGEDSLLIDPTHFDEDSGKSYAISYYAPSWDSRYVLYGIAESGSENTQLCVIDTKSGEFVDQPISRAYYFGGSWSPDNRSFFYTRFPEMKDGMPATEKQKNSRAYLHRLGTDIETDPVILGYGITPLIQSPVVIPYVSTGPESDYAFALLFKGTQKELELHVTAISALEKDKPVWKKIFDATDQVTNLKVFQDQVYMMTHKDTPHFKLVSRSLQNPDVSNDHTVLEESDLIISSLAIAQDALYVQAKDNGCDRIMRISHGGKAEPLQLPFDGAVNILRTDRRMAGVLLDITSWTKASSIYEYDPTTHQITETGLQPKGPYDAPDNLIAKEAQVKSHDGTWVPLSIVHRKEIQLDGSISI